MMDAQLELLALACFADPARDLDPAVDAFADWQCGQPLTLTAEQARAAIRCVVVASQLLELITAGDHTPDSVPASLSTESDRCATPPHFFYYRKESARIGDARPAVSAPAPRLEPLPGWRTSAANRALAPSSASPSCR